MCRSITRVIQVIREAYRRVWLTVDLSLRLLSLCLLQQFTCVGQAGVGVLHTGEHPRQLRDPVRISHRPDTRDNGGAAPGVRVLVDDQMSVRICRDLGEWGHRDDLM